MKPLRAWRQSKAMSAEDLAKQAGVSTKTISDIELGKVRPKARTMQRISGLLGVDPFDIAEFSALYPLDRRIPEALREQGWYARYAFTSKDHLDRAVVEVILHRAQDDRPLETAYGIGPTDFDALASALERIDQGETVAVPY